MHVTFHHFTTAAYLHGFSSHNRGSTFYQSVLPGESIASAKKRLSREKTEKDFKSLTVYSFYMKIAQSSKY